MNKTYKQIVTVFVNADVQGEENEPYFNVLLVNFSGTLSIIDGQSDDIGLINEAVGEWSREINEHVKAHCRFELTLRRETEGLETYYDVVHVEDLDGVLPRGAL